MPDFTSSGKDARDKAAQSQDQQPGSVFGPPKAEDDETLDKTKGYGFDGFGHDTSKQTAGKTYFHRADEVNIYAEQHEERYGMDPRAKHLIVLTIAAIVLTGLAMVLPYDLVSSGRPITPALINTYFMENVHDFFAVFTDPASAGLYSNNICRYIVIALTGAGLGVVGAVYQGSLKNALASPTTLGVSAGAQIGITLFVLLTPSALTDMMYQPISAVRDYLAGMDLPGYIWLVYGKAICSLLGSFGAVVFVLLIAKIAGHGKTSSIWLVVAGTVFASAAGTVVTTVRYYFTQTNMGGKADAISKMQTTAFTNCTSLPTVIIVAVSVAVCMAIVMSMRSRLMLLSFSEDEARSMGIDNHKVMLAMVSVSTVLVSVLVAFCGTVGFIGFLMPHITRKVVGPDFRYLVPASGLTGALMTVGTYYITSVIGYGVAANIGLYTSIVGSIVFAVMIIKQKGKVHADWI